MTKNKSNKPILVIGGGISGITTAIELAEVGRKVILVEKLPYLGGRVIKMNNYFPKLCPPTCGLEINFRRIKQNRNITIYPSTTLERIKGEKGNYLATININPQYINDNCTSCGKCSEVCPEERNNEFNYNLDKTKVAYLPHEMAYPWKYVIDEKRCKKESCNKCIEVCEYAAIDFSKQKEQVELEVSAVVLATGWEPYDKSKLESLTANNHPDVITNVILERLIAANGPTQGKLQKYSDKDEPKSIAFIQCAGSRDENHLSHCSAVCCSASIKQALTIAESYPELRVFIFYIDLRLSGRNEDILKKAESVKNITFVKGKAGKVELLKEQNALMVGAEDILSGKKSENIVDMVVLATGIKADKSGFTNLISQNAEEQFVNADLLRDGIFAVSCTKKPMDVSASLKDATGAALKAIQTIT